MKCKVDPTGGTNRVECVNRIELVRHTAFHLSSHGFHNIQKCISKYSTAVQCINIERCSTTQINKEKSKIEDEIHNSSLQWGLVLLCCQSRVDLCNGKGKAKKCKNDDLKEKH